jgi:hypothetical protein
MHELNSPDACGTNGGGQSYIPENTPQRLNNGLSTTYNGLDTCMNVWQYHKQHQQENKQ